MTDDADKRPKSGDRDEHGHFLPGHSVRSPGRPPTPEAEKLRAALRNAVGNGTMEKWAKAMRAKLEKGDQWATEFTFDRHLGKVTQGLEVNGQLEHLLGSWASGDISDTDQAENSE